MLAHRGQTQHLNAAADRLKLKLTSGRLLMAATGANEQRLSGIVGFDDSFLALISQFPQVHPTHRSGGRSSPRTTLCLET